jgi:hypothetical protein
MFFGTAAAVFFYSVLLLTRPRRRASPDDAGLMQVDAYAGFNRLYEASRKGGPIVEPRKRRKSTEARCKPGLLICLSWKIRAACDCQILTCEEIPPALVVGAAAEAANQVSYTESNGGSRVRALLYGCAEEVLSPAGAFANSFHGIRRRLLHLSVDILRGTFHLFCLALELTFYVAGSSPQSLFHPAADVFGITDNAIF